MIIKAIGVILVCVLCAIQLTQSTNLTRNDPPHPKFHEILGNFTNFTLPDFGDIGEMIENISETINNTIHNSTFNQHLQKRENNEQDFHVKYLCVMLEKLCEIHHEIIKEIQQIHSSKKFHLKKEIHFLHELIIKHFDPQFLQLIHRHLLDVIQQIKVTLAENVGQLDENDIDLVKWISAHLHAHAHHHLTKEEIQQIHNYIQLIHNHLKQHVHATAGAAGVIHDFHLHALIVTQHIINALDTLMKDDVELIENCMKKALTNCEWFRNIEDGIRQSVQYLKEIVNILSAHDWEKMSCEEFAAFLHKLVHGDEDNKH